MKPNLSPAQSRALALSLLLLVVLAAVAAVALPAWLLHTRYDDFLEDYTDKLKRYRNVAAQRPAIEEQIKIVEARGSRQYYLKSSSPPSAAAELQGLVTRIVENHKGKLVSSQALPAGDVKAGEPLKVSTSVRMSAPIVSLMLILHSLETSQPYLFVDQLMVQGIANRTYKPVPGVEPEFVVQITVSGYAPAGGGKP